MQLKQLSGDNAMKRTCKDVGARWLDSRVPEQRTGEEALKFSDECWAEGLRLAASRENHYQHIMDVVRWSLTKSKKKLPEGALWQDGQQREG